MQVLPAILAYPTISLMTLAIRSPEFFYPHASSSSSSSSSDPSSSSSSSGTTANKTGYVGEERGEVGVVRLPRLDELRLFTAGSDSGDLVERCLMTGRVLVSRPRCQVEGDMGAGTDGLVVSFARLSVPATRT